MTTSSIDTCIPTDSSFDGLSLDAKIAVGSSIVIFVFSSVLFFVIGFVFGQFCQKRKQTTESLPPCEATTTPLYEDISLPQDSNQKIELKTNVAYGPLRVPQ